MEWPSREMPTRSRLPQRSFDKGTRRRLQVELSLACDELVAALYGNLVAPDDLAATDSDLRQLIAAVVACEGLWSIQQQARAILEAEAVGAVTAPEWLARVRQRVHALLDLQPASAPSQDLP